MLEEINAIGSVPTCRACGSERVVKSAWACWNPEFGLWELETVFDQEHCHQCEKATELNWSPSERPPSNRIRELNDRFRMHGIGNGTVFVTSGVQAEGDVFVVAAVKAVRTYSKFNDDNDPWGEHDFGAVEIETQKVFFKIDYYASENLDAGSENPVEEHRDALGLRKPRRAAAYTKLRKPPNPLKLAKRFLASESNRRTDFSLGVP